LLGSGLLTAGNQYFSVKIEFPAKKAKFYEFIVDTAASHTLIAEKASRELEAQATGVSASGTAATGSSIGGQKQVILGEGVCDGGVSLGPISPVAMPQLPFDYDLHGVAGILGLETLSRFDLEFNFNTQELILHSPGSLQNLRNLTQGLIPVQMQQIPGFGLYYISVSLGRSSVKGVVDTGASGSVFNRHAAAMNNLQMPGSISGVISGAGSGQIAMQETIS